jgi:hypothetical protein
MLWTLFQGAQKAAHGVTGHKKELLGEHLQLNWPYGADARLFGLVLPRAQ